MSAGPIMAIPSGLLRTSPFLTRDGVDVTELVSGRSFSLSVDEGRLLDRALSGLQPRDLDAPSALLAEELRRRRLLLDGGALADIGARTIGSLDLEIAGSCNAECIFCPREPLRNGRGVGVMHAETFAALLRSLGSYLRFVGFAGIGEPTLNRRLPEFVAALTARGVQTALVTNGSLLDDALITALLDAGLGSIQVSFNGLDRASYEEHMVGLDFESVRARVERLVARARGRLPIYISAVETERNQRQLEGFVEHWRALGVEAQVVRCHSRGGTILQLRPAATAPAVGPPRCGLFASRAFVSWDGRVLACCHDIDGASELGNVRTDSAETIIARKLDIMQQRDWFPICNGCDEPARLEPIRFG